MTYSSAMLVWGCLLLALGPSRVLSRQLHARWDSGSQDQDQPSSSSSSSQFVTSMGNQFFLAGKPFNFAGADAYWLPMLNTTDSVDKVMSSMKATKVSVVRIWGFNDVTEIPPNNATYFQLWQNGTATINNGTNGLQRLDTVIGSAERHGLKVLITTTNNWNPQDTNGTHGVPGGNLTAQENFPHGFLSNDYGGMDLYVRQIRGETGLHDDFFDDNTIKNAFKTYLTALVTRYADNTTIFGWELANDPRCNSTLPAKTSCSTTTITMWHSEFSGIVKQLDPNHLVASGTQGFQCMQELAECPKLFPLNAPAPPRTSPGPTAKLRRRSVDFNSKAMREIRARTRKNRSPEVNKKGEGPMVRGRWAASAARRQTTLETGPSFDGTFGVDSQDILNIPDIGFSTLQLFPDQNTYLPPDPNVNATQNVIEEGVNWIKAAAAAAQQVGKPVLMSAFGLVSQNNSQFFVPFNSTIVQPQNNDSSSSAIFKREAINGLTDVQQANVYMQWVDAAVQAEVSGIIQYEWGQPGLTTQGGGDVVTQQPISSNVTTAPNPGGAATAPNTPNAGYGAQQGTGAGTMIGMVTQNAAALQAARNLGIT